MDRLDSLRVLAKAAELGGLSSAARALGISPSGASQHIRSLEEHFGTRLLDRTTRRIALTEAGEAVLVHAQRMLESLDEARSAATALQARPTGRLRVSVPVTYGARVLARIMPGFLEEYPAVELDVVAEDRRVDLLAERFDLAIRIGKLDDASLIATLLADSPLILCCAPSFVSQYGNPQTPEDLKHLPCLEYGLRRTPRRWRLYNGGGEVVEVAIRGPLTATNGELLRAAAIRGLGVILTPRFIVESDLDDGTLVQVLEGYRAADAHVYAVRPPGRYIPAKVRHFIDYLRFALRKPQASS